MKFEFFNTKVPLVQKGRRYPIQKDEEGQSLRQRCFKLFSRRRNAREAAEILGMKLATARRYYSEWNRCPPIYEETYKSLRNELKRKGEISPEIIRTLKEALNMPECQIVDILSQPYGLQSLLKGKYVRIRKQELYGKQEMRLEAALQLVVNLEQIGVPLEWIHREIQNLIRRAVTYTKSKKGFDSSQVFDESAQYSQ
jgi:hypothetical protein